MGQHDGWRFGNALTHFRYRSRVMVREGEDMIYDLGGTPIVDVEGTDIDDVEGTLAPRQRAILGLRP